MKWIYTNRMSIFFIIVMFFSAILSCTSPSGNNSSAKSDFDDSDNIITEGSLDELDYEIRTDAFLFTNNSVYSATLSQHDSDGELVEVNYISARSAEDVLSGNSATTYGFINTNARTGEIFFKGGYSVVADVIIILKDELATSLFEAEIIICLFKEANALTGFSTAQLQQDVEDCSTIAELSVEKLVSIFTRIATVTLSIISSPINKVIELKE